MKKFVLLAIAMLLSAATFLLAWLWLERLSLPYNEQGRYFDAAHGVVYDEGAVTSYGLLTALCALLTMSLASWTFRTWRK